MTKLNKLLLVVLIIFIFSLLSFWQSTKRNASRIKQQDSGQTKMTEIESNEGNVIVSVKPKVLQIGKKPVFEIKLDTHSVDLSFDIGKQSVLSNDKNNIYSQPVWDGSPSGGHHREGTLTFTKPLSETSSVRLTIKNIAGIPERKFRWQLN